MTEPLLKTPDAAKLLAISEKTLFNLTKAGEIPAIRVGRRAVRYSMADLTAYAEKKKMAAA